jgi:autoinducer-2 kinase
VQKGYLIIDIGTGNTRVGITSIEGELLALETMTTVYFKEHDFPDSNSFDPKSLLEGIIRLAKKVRKKLPEEFEILAVLSTSQREGIVLLDANGESIIGLPNIDNRGLEWEKEAAPVYNEVYRLTGRWPVTIFSALKLCGVRERQPHIWNQIAAFTSISDWIGYELTGHLVYEPSQASETLLYNVEKGEWSEELCNIFSINSSWLPEIQKSGSVLGGIKSEYIENLGLTDKTVFIVGGADTQLAVKATDPEIDDIVIVSGTTTPITKVVDHYFVDNQARCWINRNINESEYIIETNAGVSGLNYQRLKNVFFPDKEYSEMEEEVLKLNNPTTISSFGTLIFDRNLPLANGGFKMNAPIHQDLTAADFVFGILFDIASSIKYNFDVQEDISGKSKSYVLGCGGGFQGKVLPQLLADLTEKEIIIKENYNQASIHGGTMICNNALGINNSPKRVIKTFKARDNNHYRELYKEWLDFRNEINNVNQNNRSEIEYAN